MAELYERLSGWWWHPDRGIYGHEDAQRPGDRPIYVRMDEPPVAVDAVAARENTDA